MLRHTWNIPSVIILGFQVIKNLEFDHFRIVFFKVITMDFNLFIPGSPAYLCSTNARLSSNKNNIDVMMLFQVKKGTIENRIE